MTKPKALASPFLSQLLSRSANFLLQQRPLVTDTAIEGGDNIIDSATPQMSEPDHENLPLVGNEALEAEAWDDLDYDYVEEDLRAELGPWTAPAEPLRPANPYTKGQMFEIRRHKACPPFGQDYPNYPGIRGCVSERDLRTKTLVEICLEHPPMKGETALDDPARTLHIVDEIRVRDDGGAQIVVCCLDNKAEGYIAKIYDPLYYGFNNRMWQSDPRDVADEADKDYCREVAAFLELDNQFGSKGIPKYYGSWTLQTPLILPEGEKLRDVRLILMEHIRGVTMVDIDPTRYTDEVRLQTLKQVFDMYSRITFAGVSHGDFAQRNIVLCNGKAASTIGRIVIIDFNFAVVHRLDDFELLYGSRSEPDEKPYSPLDQWWEGGNCYAKFGNWLPASWEARYRPLQEWLYEQWGKSKVFQPHREPLEWSED